MGDSKGLLAIGASILVFIIWYSFVVPKFWPQEVQKPPVQSEAVTAGKESKSPEEVPVTEKTTKEIISEQGDDVEEVVSTIETDGFIATFSNYGAAPTSWELKKYTVTKEDGGEMPVDLIPAKRLAVMPLSISLGGFSLPAVPKYTLVEEKDGLLRYVWSSPDTIIEKLYTLGIKKYDITLDVKITNRKKKELTTSFAIGWSAEINETKNGGFFGFLKRPSDIRAPVYLLDGKVKREASPAKLDQEEVIAGRVYWAGIEDRYFLSAIVPREEESGLSIDLSRFGGGSDLGFFSGVLLPKLSIAPSGSETISFTVYAGPKEMDALKAVGMNLDKSIDFGWFTFIAIPILYVLKFLYSIVHNYGIAIILLTILIKILLHPISKKSMSSMKEMKKLQPRLAELKAKYKDNKERQNAETMALFKSHKVNPMSGCLPMVLQFPVYIALYRVLWNSIELYHAPFFWFYKDLSQPDPYFITPVLLGVAMFVQQKMTPSATADPAQQKMMMIMPLMFSVFLAFLPVGLVVYILVNTVMTVAQQWMTNNDIRFRDLIRGKIPKKLGI